MKLKNFYFILVFTFLISCVVNNNDSLESPINIDTSIIKNNHHQILNPLKINYKIVNFIYDEKYIRVFDSKTSLLNNKNSNLIQFHFHTPSEHLVDKRQYPLEIHFVNMNEDGTFSVVGLFAKIGRYNPNLQNIIKLNKHKTLKAFRNFKSIFPKNLDYYHYMGSLTHPPEIHNVYWYIIKEPIEISKKQLDELDKYYKHDGNHIMHSLHGKNIYLYHN